jgi:RimJ/RimL family protein N-acetyltransferase
MAAGLIRFRRFMRADLDSYASWFSDEDLVNSPNAPDADWLADVEDPDGGSVAEIATIGANSDPCAVIRYDIDGDGGISLTFVVSPALRGQGIGLRVLEAFLARAAERFDHADIWIEADNEAGLALARRLRFRPSGAADEDGFIEFHRALRA